MDVFISYLDSHSDGTHSLLRIHRWASDAMLHFSKSVLMNTQTNPHLWMTWDWVQQMYICLNVFKYYYVYCTWFSIPFHFGFNEISSTLPLRQETVWSETKSVPITIQRTLAALRCKTAGPRAVSAAIESWLTPNTADPPGGPWPRSVCESLKPDDGQIQLGMAAGSDLHWRGSQRNKEHSGTERDALLLW